MKKNGLVAPFEVYIKYHYSQLQEFTFIAFFSSAKELFFDGYEARSILAKDVMFILADNVNGKIIDVNKLACEKLKIDKKVLSSKENTMSDKELTLTDLSR